MKAVVTFLLASIAEAGIQSHAHADPYNMWAFGRGISESVYIFFMLLLLCLAIYLFWGRGNPRSRATIFGGSIALLLFALYALRGCGPSLDMDPMVRNELAIPLLIFFVLFLGCFGGYTFWGRGMRSRRFIAFGFALGLFILALFAFRGCGMPENRSEVAPRHQRYPVEEGMREERRVGEDIEPNHWTNPDNMVVPRQQAPTSAPTPRARSAF